MKSALVITWRVIRTPIESFAKTMEIRADTRGRETDSGREVGKPELSRFVNETDGVRISGCQYFPQAAGTTLMLKVCLFTNTPDEHFVIDTLPGCGQVVFASPYSGHGFKFSSVGGEILADLATTGKTTLAADFLRLARSQSGAVLRGVHG